MIFFSLNILFLTTVIEASASLVWKYDSKTKMRWASNCDFHGDDFLKSFTKRDFCASSCLNNSQCTHFSWSDIGGGTCWLKKGKISKEIAKPKLGVVCGYLDYNKGFFIIAHMTNNPKLIEYAVKSGANAIEVDVRFDENTGEIKRIRHGFPCDCCSINNSSLCIYDKICGGSTNHITLMEYIAKNHSNLPLIYFDGKTLGLNSRLQKIAGQNIVDMIISNLLNNGFNGQIVLNSPFEQEYIRAAANYVSSSIYKSRFFYTLDEEATETTIKFLQSIPTSNIICSSRYTFSCFPIVFPYQFKIANTYMRRNEISGMFAYSIDRVRGFKGAYDAGIRGILTNNPLVLYNWAKKNRVYLARLNDGTLLPAKS